MNLKDRRKVRIKNLIQNMLFKVKARYWPNNDMGDSPAEDLVKIKDIFR